MLRVIFIGYMGIGKTTFGRALAKSLNLTFYDLDWYIASRRRKTITEIFEEEGAEAFRDIERNMLHEVAEFEDVVISCGGGTPCFYDNMEYMNQQAVTIYLKADLDFILNHLQDSKNQRPLLKGKTEAELRDFVSEQLPEREKYYMQAKHIIELSDILGKEKIYGKIEEIKELLL